ncbi:MAG: hypothetical protein ACRD1N_04325 [Terriglobia bacterium]
MKTPLKVLAIVAACALWAASLAAQTASSVAPAAKGQSAPSAESAATQTTKATPATPAAQPASAPTALAERPGAAPAKPGSAGMIPAGTTLRVTLDTTLTDKTNKSGDPFTGEISSPVYITGKDVIPQYSTVNGHIAFLKPSGRFAGKAQMRLVLDNITTPDGVVFPLAGTLEEAQGGVCAHTAVTGKTKADEEGTITGCGKSKKKAAEAAAIVGGMGAGVGASIGMGKEVECEWYGYCPPGGSGIGTDIMYGAGIGAGTALIYTLFKHERHIVLVQGSLLTFTVDRTTMAEKTPATSDASAE